MWAYGKADWEAVKSHLQTFSANLVSDQGTPIPVNELWLTIKQELLQTMPRLIPSKQTSPQIRVPWITQDIRALLRKRNKLYLKLRKVRANFDQHSQNLRTKYKALKSLVQKQVRRAYWDYLEGMLNMDPDPTDYRPKSNTVTKKFWSFIKAQKTDSTGTAPLKQNGILKSDPLEKAEILNQQFQSVFTDEDTQHLPDMGPSPYAPIANIHISTEGVFKLLQNINPSKASGPDSIPGRLLKECAREVAPALRMLFQRSVTTGQLPDDWKVKAETVGILNPHDWTTFWVLFDEGHVEVGQGARVGLRRFLYWHFEQPYTIRAVSVSNGYGFSGDWQLNQFEGRHDCCLWNCQIE